MVDVAQLVRAPVCGTGGRGFKSRHPPHIRSLELLVLGIYYLVVLRPRLRLPVSKSKGEHNVLSTSRKTAV